MKKDKHCQKQNLSSHLRLKNRVVWISVLLVLLGCRNSEDIVDAYIGIHNFSKTDACQSEAIIEFALNVKSIPLYNFKTGQQCSINKYPKAGMIIHKEDTLFLYYNPYPDLDLLHKTIPGSDTKNLKYFFWWIKKFQGYSLREINIEVKKKLSNSYELYLLNNQKIFEKIESKMNLHFYYSFDGKIVSNDSQQYSRVMNYSSPKFQTSGYK